MNEQYIRTKITELRIKKCVSEHKMSLDLGHSKNYIRNITTGSTLPSWPEFFYICKYFEITPSQFFDCKTPSGNAVLSNRLLEKAQALEDDDMELLISIAERLKRQP